MHGSIFERVQMQAAKGKASLGFFFFIFSRNGSEQSWEEGINARSLDLTEGNISEAEDRARRK